MNKILVFTVSVILFFGTCKADGPYLLCQDPKFVADFTDYPTGNRTFKPDMPGFIRLEGENIFTSSELIQTFHPFLTCLQRWVEDGGEADGLMITEWERMPDSRLSCRLKAAELIRALALAGGLRNERNSVCSWVRSSLENWPLQVQMSGWGILTRLNDKEAIPLLRKAARIHTGFTKQAAWEMLAMVAPDRAAEELEPLTQTEDDYRMLGWALMRVSHQNAIPSLRRLVQRFPQWGSLRDHLSRIERGDTARSVDDPD